MDQFLIKPKFILPGVHFFHVKSNFVYHTVSPQLFLYIEHHSDSKHIFSFHEYLEDHMLNINFDTRKIIDDFI